MRAIWNGDAARAFRRRIVAAQENVDICALCSGYGVPRLLHARPMTTEIHRLSLESGGIDGDGIVVREVKEP
ncbi:MAG: hypothetical protein FD149_155 [Rhodospirillaceae bacterium]|nr:MAG: hypothetical protein FD149_155 [Rhodospirillaceae bacterium]